MTAAISPWLETMRWITGISAANDNDTIVGWAKKIGELYPEMTGYAAGYTRDTIAWCGLTVAYCMAAHNIRPVFGADDVHRFLYALAWADWGTKADTPQQGDVVVFQWQGGSDAGGHHVTLLEHVQGGSYVCRGGNQSHRVNVTAFPASDAIAVRRPPDAAAMASPPDATAKPSGTYFTAITATVFKDETTAYDGHAITDEERTIALPWLFKGPRTGAARIWRNGRGVLCDVGDRGPWYDGRPGWPDDPWGITGTRPRAESDPRTNGAGIDLSPALAALLGIDGKGKVDVEFLMTAAAPSPASPGQTKMAAPVAPSESVEDMILDLVKSSSA